MRSKIWIHLITLPRHFAAPFFGSSLLLGGVLAGGRLDDLHLWLGLIGGLFIMFGGHSLNSYLDFVWTKLDAGSERSVEKRYTSGQSVIPTGKASPKEVLCNGIGWYVLSLIPLGYIAVEVSLMVLPLAFLGMLVTFFYAWGKFNYTHELVLGIGSGPIPVLIGMFSVNPSPPWLVGLAASVPIGICLSFLGLSIDEYPDAEANLKKGVKSIAYKVWEYGVDLPTYVNFWVVIIYVYQVFLISAGILVPLTAVTFVLVPILFGLGVMIKSDFDRFSPWYVIVGAFYPTLLLGGQVVG